MTPVWDNVNRNFRGKTMPSRRFLIQQACLNVLAAECGQMYGGDVRKYAMFRFGDQVRPQWSRWAGFHGLCTSVRSEFRNLKSQYEA